MPTPKKNESESDFVKRYMSSSEAAKSYPDDKQRVAVAYSVYKIRNKKKKK